MRTLKLPAGSPAQIRAEIDRLTAKLAMLKSADATIAAIKPDANLDPEGRRLSVMLQWRNQRIAAIEAEIPRLQQQAMRLAKWDRVWRSDAAATNTQDTRAFNTVNKELIQWLEENGAKVRQHCLCGSAAGSQGAHQGAGNSTRGQDEHKGAVSHGVMLPQPAYVMQP